MKAKISRGGGFRGIAEYALGDEKDAEFVAGNVDGRTPRELSAEFALTRRLRPKTPRPVWHCSLSLPEGERLDSERWEAVVHDFLDGMLFDRENHQFFAVRHTDTDYDHVHIIVSRIGLDAGLWHGKWEARRAIDLTQKLEMQHGLTRTPGYMGRAEVAALTKGEIELAVRTEQAPPKKVLQALIKKAAEGQPTVVQFAEKLVMAGVEVRANLASTGRLNGFSFGLDGYSFKGSQLGKKFGWKALEKQGVSYEQDRDCEQLQRITRARAADSDDIRIADDAAHDQRPVERVSQPDGQPTDGIVIQNHERDAGPTDSTRGQDGATVDRSVARSRDGYQATDIHGASANEREIGRSLERDDGRSGESLRPADWRVARRDSEDLRGDGETVGRREAGAGAEGQGVKDRDRELERIDQEHRDALNELRNQRRSDQRKLRDDGQGNIESEENQRPNSAAVVAGRGFGGDRVDVRKYADYLGVLAARHTMTPERARGIIDREIAKNPAPARPAKPHGVSRLSRWFNATKIKLSKVIDKARDYFHDATAKSAEKAGWGAEEISSAGLSGGHVERLLTDQEQQKKAVKVMKSEPKVGLKLLDDRADLDVSGPTPRG